jgi:hypothetical protein
MSKPQERSPDGTPAAAACLEHTDEKSVGDVTKNTPREEPVVEEMTYEPIPPRRLFSVQVTCRLQGRGEPLPFPDADA